MAKKKLSQKDLLLTGMYQITNVSGKAIESVIMPNGVQVGLSNDAFKKGATVYGGVLLNNESAPKVTTNRLYNENGVLKFNGAEIKGGGGGGGSNAGWLSGSQIIYTTGSVGIHTHSPDRFLEINASGSANGIRLSWNATAGSASDYAELLSADSNGSLKLLTVDSDGTSGHIMLMPDGNVGVNTETPDYTLDVAGNIGLDENIYHNGDGNTYIGFPSNDTVNIVAGGESALKLDNSTANPKIQLNNTNADIDVQIMADDGSVILHTDAGTNRVGIGTTSPKAGFVDVQDYNTVSWTSQLSDGESGGHIIKLGAGTTVAGQLYHLTASAGGTWSDTDASSPATGAYMLLGIALGTSPTSDGMLLRGYARIASTLVDGTAVVGAPVYVSPTATKFTFSRPGSAGEFVRVIGYLLGGSNGQIYFNPDGTFVEVA